MRKLVALITGLVIGSAASIFIGSCGDLPRMPGMVYLVVPEAASCPNGGITLFTALDTNFSEALELDSDSEIKEAQVCHGAAASGEFSNTELLDPCGDAPGVVDEVLIRLADGRVLSSFSANAAGDYTRFALLPVPGTYMTTDGSNCQFSLSAEGRLL